MDDLVEDLEVAIKTRGEKIQFFSMIKTIEIKEEEEEQGAGRGGLHGNSFHYKKERHRAFECHQ